MLMFPLPDFVHPEMNPMNFAIIQLILVYPSMIVGYKFFPVGFSALVRRSPNMDSLIAIGTSNSVKS